jgi:single-strand DNA-binding protein
MNQVALVGNITDDLELRYTQSGAALAGFTVAVSHRSKHNGQWQDVNDGFFRCTAWRSVAENASRTLKKGMRVFVAGKLVQRSWQDNDDRRDPGHPRRSGPPVRNRRGHQVHRRGFPGPCGGCRVILSRDPASSEPGFGRASTR